MNRPAILIDIGGVLVPDHLTAAAAEWSTRLGISPHAFLAALFGGNDDQVLIGRTTEEVLVETSSETGSASARS